MRIIILIVILISYSSCYTYKVFPKAFRDQSAPRGVVKAHVLNPDLKKEFQILKLSGLFELTSLPNAEVTISLDTLQRSLVCGQPLVASMVSLGQIPVYLPDRYIFRFQEHKNDQTIAHGLELQVAKRIWFWDLFNTKKQFTPKAAIALRGAYLSSDGSFRNLSN